ncbi:4Fe-4S binding protein [uncultured Bacteroides sp.]|uniref:4Fe-4S binding protein n=1 Tax=uncultured Bacteroides sp. TaxID=162156 RepID=UPI002AAB639E|nr:4Fe-4S binding protein [uncultured Bacteroides sp.]
MSEVLKSTKRKYKWEIELPKINPELCIGCGECKAICPMEALIITSEIIFIDENKCGKCRLCAAVCPVEAIN